MNAVLGLAELLERPDLPAESRQKFLRLIRDRSKHLLHLVNDILCMSMITTGQLTSVKTPGNMCAFIEKRVEEFKRSNQDLRHKNIALSVNCAVRLQGEVRADFNNLNRVLQNLLTNSAKFTAKGLIEVICTVSAGDEFHLAIRDTGIGVPSEQHNAIFQPFRHGGPEIHQDYGGSGLGLAISKGLIELWGGRIWVESEPGRGSVFHFTVPYKRDM